jgi:hypothetical protein
LPTFVMIGQNRHTEFQHADHDFTPQELELKTNTELTREIRRLTTELHRRLINHPTRLARRSDGHGPRMFSPHPWPSKFAARQIGADLCMVIRQPDFLSG